ncbi:hypothetical protein LCGC14_2643830 [marine sediment metagenome]|uniref:Uncharacterized protein n=1 Tax=marine sediment metagenome TaxID=412755 RepID=A0A0F8ZWR5_9ZZZZ
MDERLARGRRWFEYHCYEGEDSSDAELWHHTHQEVIVLARIPNCDTSRMYHVEFTDGFKWDVFDDELIASPKDFERPDYKAVPVS